MSGMTTIVRSLSAGVLAATVLAAAGSAFGQTASKPQAPANQPPAKRTVPAKGADLQDAQPNKGQVMPAPHDHGIEARKEGVQEQKLGVQNAPADAPPVIEFDELLHDFGAIDDTKPATHSFTFKNVSDRPVKITKVHASCGCTAARPSKEVYAPGEEGTINASFDPKNRKGRNDKTITVETDHPDAQRILLKISSYVSPLVSVDPMKVYFPAIERGKGTTSTMKVTGRSAGFSVQGIQSDAPFLQARVIGAAPVEVAPEDGQPAQSLTEVEIEVSLTPDAPVGRFQKTLTLTTSDPRAATFTIPVGGEILGDLRATPDRMNPRVQAPNTPFEAQIRLDSRKGEAFEVLSVDVDGPETMSLVADVEQTEINGKPVYLVKLNGVTPPTFGAFSGTVTVVSTLDDREPISIPLYGNVFSRPARAAAANPVSTTQPKITTEKQ